MIRFAPASFWPATRSALRLLLALLAVAVALAGPPAALAAGGTGPESPPMPCHEGAGSLAAPLGMAVEAMSAPVEGGRHALPLDGAARHLCCVLGLVIVPPSPGPTLDLPRRIGVALGLPIAPELNGHAPAIPVPPPRRA